MSIYIDSLLTGYVLWASVIAWMSVAQNWTGLPYSMYISLRTQCPSAFEDREKSCFHKQLTAEADDWKERRCLWQFLFSWFYLFDLCCFSFDFYIYLNFCFCFHLLFIPQGAMLLLNVSSLFSILATSLPSEAEDWYSSIQSFHKVYDCGSLLPSEGMVRQLCAGPFCWTPCSFLAGSPSCPSGKMKKICLLSSAKGILPHLW